MFCKNCGKQLGPETNFCPACGTVVPSPERPSPPNPSGSDQHGTAAFPSGQAASAHAGPGEPDLRSPKLERPRSPRILGGVCAAFALHLGWNLNLVRVATAIFGLFYGLGILAYIACWIILPEAPYALPPQSR